MEQLSATQEVHLILALVSPLLFPILCALFLSNLYAKQRLEREHKRLLKLYSFYRISGRRK